MSSSLKQSLAGSGLNVCSEDYYNFQVLIQPEE